MKFIAEKIKIHRKSADVRSKRAPGVKEGSILMKVVNEALTPLKLSLLKPFKVLYISWVS